MATLTVSPNPALPSTVVAVSGAGFPNAKTRLSLDGQGTSTNIFRPRKDGTFNVGITVSSTAKTQTLIAEQQSGTWKEVARTSITVQDTAPPPPPPTGWVLAFSDDFATWDPSKYFVYPSTWHDTSGNGTYSPDIISASSGILNLHIATVNGVRKVAAFCPLPTGKLSARGDLLGMRVEFRLRADRMLGYKGVPLLWPMSGVWPRDGEVDGPESNFDARPSAFVHRQGATSGSDQDYYAYPTGTSWQDWHTYVTEWVPGVSAEYFIDGISIGKSTSRVPNTAMHLVMQFETQLNGVIPDPTISGNVQIEYLKVWARG